MPFVALALVTIVLGLVVHRGAVALAAAPRDVAGDALWAMMMAWWVGVVAPHRAPLARAAVALTVCFAVEASQLVHTAGLDALRRTVPGRLVLGSDFDARDLAAYALGVASALVLELGARRLLARRSRRVLAA
jgi:hypothetical protein